MMERTYTKTRWSLNDLFETHDSPEMKVAISKLETKVTDFETVRHQLNEDIDQTEFLELVRRLEEITRLASRIYDFGALQFAADTQNQDSQVFLAKVEQLMAEMQNQTLFFGLWWKGLDDAPAERLMAGSGDFRYWLEEMRHFKPHTLSEAEEKVINIKDVTGSRALNTLYDSITNRYVFKLKVDGEVKELTRGQLMVYVHDNDPQLRAGVYQELYRVYGEDGPILGQLYQTLVRDWRNEQMDMRHFDNPIAVRNLVNDIPDEVVNTLLDVCERNASIFQRFFELKARLLGVERLRRYDIYAPVAGSDKKYKYQSAVDLVLDSFSQFNPQFSKLAQRVFTDDHLDSEVRKGKRDGAFCATVTPDLTPWVLLNYQGRPRDVATLAHELGHAIHSMLAEHHSIFTQHSSLPLAETASTFAEMLLIDGLLAQEKDQSVRQDLLFRQVDDAYATILRQAFFALFERQAHEMVKQDASVDDLSKAYQENLKKQFGEAVEVSAEFGWEWVSIPHIYHVPFYVYAYAFGQLLVLSLYQQYKEEGEAFKSRFIKILTAGGSDAPVRILTEAGIDVYDAGFWQGGFDVILDMIEKLEDITLEL
ncbi:MAG: M3 family oligoendopeptidase [Anaerolineales bacterium]